MKCSGSVFVLLQPFRWMGEIRPHDTFSKGFKVARTKPGERCSFPMRLNVHRVPRWLCGVLQNCASVPVAKIRRVSLFLCGVWPRCRHLVAVSHIVTFQSVDLLRHAERRVVFPCRGLDSVCVCVAGVTFPQCNLCRWNQVFFLLFFILFVL